MNRTTYLIPAFAAVFALMFAFASPLAMAEPSDDMHGKWTGQKNHKIIEVEGFVGSIQITDDVNRQTLRNQVSVSLSEAADGLDVLGGHIGVVVNENNDKYLVWTLKSIQKDSESETATATIYVVDAADAANTTSITKEIDHSQKIEKRVDRLSNKIDKFEERLSESSGDADRATFVEKLQELKATLESRDSERVSELREELKDIRIELDNTKSLRK